MKLKIRGKIFGWMEPQNEVEVEEDVGYLYVFIFYFFLFYVSIVSDEEVDDIKQRGSKIRSMFFDRTREIGLGEDEGHFLY